MLVGNLSGKWVRLTWTDERVKLENGEAPAPDERAGTRVFETVRRSINKIDLQLKLAKWPNGSRAWLDPRGLLHLRSADETCPEVSVVLGNRFALAAWSSDGHRVGSPYFTGEPEAVPTAAVAAHVETFCARVT